MPSKKVENVVATSAPIVQHEELDVFSGNLLQTSIVSEELTEFYPMSPLAHMEPINIEVSKFIVSYVSERYDFLNFYSRYRPVTQV